MELSDSEGETHARERFEAVLGGALEAGEIDDAAIAESEAQSAALWHLRESITLAVQQTGKCLKHDISVPTSRVARFVRETGETLEAAFPGMRHVTFGHLGDGNLHYNLMKAEGIADETFLASGPAIARLVHDSVRDFEGSISAEQGIGQLRVGDLRRYKDGVELALMRRIKSALDPGGLMNPGKVLPGTG